jgi:hypothetical protein
LILVQVYFGGNSKTNLNDGEKYQKLNSNQLFINGYDFFMIDYDVMYEKNNSFGFFSFKKINMLMFLWSHVDAAHSYAFYQNCP